MRIDPGDYGDEQAKPKNTASSFKIFYPELIRGQGMIHS
jgi:hypothetical protein